jgi:excisionase family DNA binding protein
MQLQLLTIEEVSRVLGIKESTVRTWIHRKIFPSQCIIKLGGCIRFREKFLEEWLNNGNLQEVG